MNWNEVLAALVIGVPSLILGVLAYRRSRQVDLVTEQSGAASNHRAGTTQVIESYQGILAEMRIGVAEAEKRCEDRIADAVDDLKRELTRRPTREELLDDNGKLRKQLIDLGQVPANGEKGQVG